jgi:TonB family protein
VASCVGNGLCSRQWRVAALCRQAGEGRLYPGGQDQRIEGTVVLESVVKSDGSVGDVSVVRSLDSVFDLDREAVKAMRQWEFKPGTKEGKDVAVKVVVEMTFSLKD